MLKLEGGSTRIKHPACRHLAHKLPFVNILTNFIRNLRALLVLLIIAAYCELTICGRFVQ